MWFDGLVEYGTKEEFSGKQSHWQQTVKERKHKTLLSCYSTHQSSFISIMSHNIRVIPGFVSIAISRIMTTNKIILYKHSIWKKNWNLFDFQVHV